MVYGLSSPRSWCKRVGRFIPADTTSAHSYLPNDSPHDPHDPQEILMSSPLLALSPQTVWQHFDDIRQIPRPSKHEERIVHHVRAWAENQGFNVQSDAVGNLVVRVPASAGKENSPTIVIQSHLDMVCEKNSDVDHDFMEDPIQVKVEGDWVKSVGTTLGSDNGLGVAAAMAVAEDPDCTHGPLELLFTLDEETGLTGAAELDGSLLAGRVMLNLDSEEDGVIYIGCAGGADSMAVFSCKRKAASPGTGFHKISVTGLRGGHSGCDIHENRANAVKLAARSLRQATQEGIGYELVSLEGGSKHNAIPREAFVELRTTAADAEKLKALLTRLSADFIQEFGAADPGLKIAIGPAEETTLSKTPLEDDTTRTLIHVLNALPHGVLSMSREVDGLVETSNNLAVVTTEAESMTITTSHRSSVMPALLGVQDAIRSICELGGAKVSVHDAYPGWKPDPSSAVVQKTIDVYEELFSKKPEIKAIHAGLECGLLLEKVPGMDAVSFGPEIRNAHSPDEMAQISSTEKFYRHLKGVLASLA